MTEHRMGAVKMADAELRSAGDLRLRIMPHAIRHKQQGEIGLIHGVWGVAAVVLRNMVGDDRCRPD